MPKNKCLEKIQLEQQLEKKPVDIAPKNKNPEEELKSTGVACQFAAYLGSIIYL